MNILGINSIFGICQVYSNGRRYTCPTKMIDNQMCFHFKKQWHKFAEYVTEYTTELYRDGEKVFTRRYK